MTTNRPSVEDLIEAVIEFLDATAQSKLTGRDAFNARVASNALAVARRDLLAGARADATETIRLSQLLGRDSGRAELIADLCGRIRAGDIRHDDHALVSLLWRMTLNRVAIDNPKYATYLKFAGGGDASD